MRALPPKDGRGFHVVSYCDSFFFFFLILLLGEVGGEGPPRYHVEQAGRQASREQGALGSIEAYLGNFAHSHGP